MATVMCVKRVFSKRMCIDYQRRYGFIVLVPEIGEDLPEKNPLLKEDGLLEFNNISIEKCVAAIGKQSIDMEKNVKTLRESLLKTKQSNKIIDDIFKEVIHPLEHFSAPLETTWGLAKTLYLGNSSLMPTKSYMSIHDRARRARLAKFTNTEIHNAIKDVNQKQLPEEKKRLLNKFLVEGKLNGIEVVGTKRLQLNDIWKEMSDEREGFRNKVATAIKQFTHVIDDYNLVKEFPPSLLQSTCVNSNQPTKGPWKVTLEPHTLSRVLEYCSDRTVRWNAWQADSRKASGYTDKSFENSTAVENIRGLRKRQANILGFENFVQMSLETKMVRDVNTLKGTLNELLTYAKPAQALELEALQGFAAENGFQGALDHSDIPYWRRKFAKQVLNYDDEILREYFQLPKVLNGLFKLAEDLYGIRIQERQNVETWHENVKFYDIFNKSDGVEPISGFYLDMYARDDDKIRLQEHSGWMVGIRNRSVMTETTPLAALIFNFNQPVYGKPSLMSHNELQILFSKFGNALQHLLTTASYSEVSGVSNIEWDAVDIPSHFMSSFLYDANILQSISSHYITGDTLPQNLFDAIINNRKFFAGFNLCHELYLSELDLNLHLKTDYWLDVVKDLWPRYNALEMDKKYSYPCSWMTVFAGEYGAAYFSHVWSQLVAADAFSAFSDEAHTQEEIGKRFRDTFLSFGGAVSPAEVFRRFRGRDPSSKALLSTLGLEKQKKSV